MRHTTTLTYLDRWQFHHDELNASQVVDIRNVYESLNGAFAPNDADISRVTRMLSYCRGDDAKYVLQSIQLLTPDVIETTGKCEACGRIGTVYKINNKKFCRFCRR